MDSILKHAINVALEDLQKDPELLAEYKEKPIVVYCNTGKKSAEAAKTLVENGYKDVTDAQGVKDYEYKNIVKYTSLTAQQFEKMDKNYTLIDVRPVDSYNEGHLEGAISVPLEELEDHLDEIPTDKPVVAYCYVGTMSAEAANTLQEKGYEAYNLLDGTDEYDFGLVK